MALSIAAHPMSRGHRFGALRRLIFWQLWRRVPGAGAQVTLAGASTFWCPAWSHLASAWVSAGFHEEELLFLRDFAGPADVLADVGANLGAYSLVAVSSGATSIAFEPDPRARAILEENVR